MDDMTPGVDVLHVVPGPSSHGVTRHASALLAHSVTAHHEVQRIATGDGAPAGTTFHGVATEVVKALAALPPAALTHLHLTDHLLADSATACADLVVELAARRPLSLTLHDLPQPEEGQARHARRRAAYARMAAAAVGVVVASQHERALLLNALAAEGLTSGGPVEVVPLPLDRAPLPTEAEPGHHDSACDPTAEIGVFGYVYPGKGHDEAIAAAGRLGPHVGVVALGRPSPGHEHLVDDYAALAEAEGRPFRATGYLADADLLDVLRAVAVPAAPHRHVSASGSIGTWLWAGRRPLVPVSRYTDELEQRCPGTLLRYGPGRPWEDLTAAAAAALADPELTWQAAGAELHPTGAEAAAGTVHLLDEWACAVTSYARPTDVSAQPRAGVTR